MTLFIGKIAHELIEIKFNGWLIKWLTSDNNNNNKNNNNVDVN